MPLYFCDKGSRPTCVSPGSQTFRAGFGAVAVWRATWRRAGLGTIRLDKVGEIAWVRGTASLAWDSEVQRALGSQTLGTFGGPSR